MTTSTGTLDAVSWLLWWPATQAPIPALFPPLRELPTVTLMAVSNGCLHVCYVAERFWWWRKMGFRIRNWNGRFVVEPAPSDATSAAAQGAFTAFLALLFAATGVLAGVALGCAVRAL